MDCQEHGIQITPMPVLHERITGRVAVEHIGQRLHLLFPGEVAATRRLFDGLKRVTDVVLAVVGMGTSWPLWLLIALAIRLDSDGPILYIQERVGKGGHPFRVIKFHTMVQNAEEGDRTVWATENDPRVTRTGRLLRRMRLDELPQLINVLRGLMSMVGPRPERPQFVGQLAEEIRFYRARHAVRPGLTGWAQIKYRYGSSVEDARIKLEYDLYYVKHRSLYLDLLILLKTIPVILRFQGT
jgi:exopolysaccharide biosynthesis polyprenyl glycosylphosphotransferase